MLQRVSKAVLYAHLKVFLGTTRCHHCNPKLKVKILQTLVSTGTEFRDCTGHSALGNLVRLHFAHVWFDLAIYMLVCLLPYTINFKWTQSNILWRLIWWRAIAKVQLANPEWQRLKLKLAWQLTSGLCFYQLSTAGHSQALHMDGGWGHFR